MKSVSKLLHLFLLPCFERSFHGHTPLKYYQYSRAQQRLEKRVFADISVLFRIRMGLGCRVYERV